MLNRYFKYAVGLMLLWVVVLAVAWVQWNHYLDTPIAFGEDGVVYEVPKGGSLSSVAYGLKAQGYLENPRLLTLYGRMTGNDRRIHAGEYLFQNGLTPRALLAKLTNGGIYYRPLTIIEGWNLEQLLRELSNHTPIITERPMTWTDERIRQIFDWDYPSAEGLFFPDTYYYYKGMPAIDLLRQSHERLILLVQQAWDERAEGLPFATPYEALIMASLIEKETAVDSERELISGVFSRRLQAGMRLQTDPSVIYGLGSAFTGKLRSADLQDATNRYNSYQHHGLPPTPIALPSQASIQAALHPAPGQALYFVAKGDGSHHFSETLAEHQAAVKKYQIEQRRADYRSTPVRK